MKVLVACEESQAVCIAFRELGHEAYSCDIQECSGGHPEWHIMGDVLGILNPSMQLNGLFSEYYGIKPFETMDGVMHFVHGKWDLLIAHPPCTFLTIAGACNIPKHPERIQQGFEAADFFKKFLEADCERIAVENPPPMKRFCLPKYTQIVRPWMYGHRNNKPICLWLKGLPELRPTNIVEKDCDMVRWVHKATGQKNHVLSGTTQIRETITDIGQKLFEEWQRPWQNSGVVYVSNNIMYYPSIILLIVEALALGFLVWSWRDAKRRAEE